MTTLSIPQHQTLDQFALDPADLDTPAARRAWRAGLLRAKTQAMHQAARLSHVGLPLLVVVMMVSIIHIWETISTFRPDHVDALALHPWFHYGSALALTVAIDAVALYVVAAGAAAAVAGEHQPHRQWATWFFLAATFFLNAAYIVRYAPSLPPVVQAWGLPMLDMLFMVLLPAFIPAAILAVKHAMQRCDVARLKLLVETTALAEMIEDPATDQPAPAATPTPAAPARADSWASMRLDQGIAASNGHIQNGAQVSGETTQATTAALVEVPPEEIRQQKPYTCERCGATLSLGQYGSMRRRGYCSACKDKDVSDGWQE